MLAGSKLGADMFQLEPTWNLLRTSFEPASVMEFGFYRHDANIQLGYNISPIQLVENYNSVLRQRRVQLNVVSEMHKVQPRSRSHRRLLQEELDKQLAGCCWLLFTYSFKLRSTFQPR